MLVQYFIGCLLYLSGEAYLTSLKLAGNPIEDFSPLADIYPNLEEKDFEMN